MSRSSTCHFLWGPRTSAKDRSKILQTFQKQCENRMKLILYKRTGEPFCCELSITPIKNERGQVVLFLCSFQQLVCLPSIQPLNADTTSSNAELKCPSSSDNSQLPSIDNNRARSASFFENTDKSYNLLDGKLERCDSKSPLRTSIGNKFTKEQKGRVHSASPSMRYRLNRDTSEPETDLLLLAPPDENRNSRSITSATSLLSGSSGQRSPCYPTGVYSWTGNSENSISSIPVSPTVLESTIDEQDTEREDGGDYTRSRGWSIRSVPESDQTSDISHMYRNHHFLFGQSLDDSVGIDQVQNNSSSVVVTVSERMGDKCSIDQSKTNFCGRSSRNGLKPLLRKCAHALESVLPAIHVAGSQSRDGSKETNNPSDSSKSFEKGFKPTDQKPDESGTCELISHSKRRANNVHSTPGIWSSLSGWLWSSSNHRDNKNSAETKPICPASYPVPNGSANENKAGEINPDEDISNGPSYSYKRRKSFAILHNIPSMKPRNKSRDKLNQQLKNLSGANVPEYKMQQFTKPNSVLLHYGMFRIAWDWIILLSTFYIAFVIPYSVSFGWRNGWVDNHKRAIDLIIEMLLILDVVFNFNTTYVNPNGQLVYNRRDLARHYARTWLLIDLLAALPVDSLLLAVQVLSCSTGQYTIPLRQERWARVGNGTEMNSSIFAHSTTEERSIYSLFQMMKLARLLRLARLFQNLSRLSQHSIIVLGLLMFSFTLLAHWFACIWYVIGIQETENVEAGWLSELRRRLNLSFSNNHTDLLTGSAKYFTALYFTCTSLTSVGFGNVSANTTAEKMFAVCVMLLGSLMHAAIFGNVTAIIQRIYARRTAFQTKTQELKDFVRVHSIPKQLKRRMEDFFQTMWAINRGINTSEVLSIYPEELRRDIALHLNREVLSLKVFDNASQDCLKSLALHIKTSFFTPGEYLIHAGDVLRRIYFVCSGSLEILENDEVVALLGKNDWFGTYINARLDCGQTIRSRCDVKSMTYCDLQSIDLNALNQVLEQYPAFKAEFTDYLYEDLSFNIQEGAEKYVDKDAIVIPAITLQLAQDNSPTSQDCFNPERRLSGVEYDGMETNSSCGGGDIERGTLQCGQPNSRATCTTKNRPKGSLHRFSESSVSSSDEMRYYPRRPSQVDKHQSKRRLRRATLGGLFNHQGKNRTEPSKNLIKTSENSPTIRRKSYSPGTDLVNNDFSTSIEPNSTSRTAVLVTELTKAVATVGDPTQLHPTKKSPAPPPQTSKTETSDQFLNVPKGISVGSTNKWNTGTSKHLISHGGTVQLGLKFCDKPSMPVVTPASSTSTPSIEDIKPFKQFTGNTLTVPDMSEAKKVSRSTLSLPLQPKIAAPPLEQYAPDTCRSQLNLGLLNIDQAKSFNPCSNDIMNRIIYQNQSLSNEMMRLHDRMGSLENQMAELLSSMKPNGVITR